MSSKTVTRSLFAALVVIATAASLPANAADKDAVLVRSRDLWRWATPSPDATGLTYDRATKRLMISDAEVDETPHWERKNFFVTTRTGRLLAARKFFRFTREPEDLAWDAKRKVLYVADDDAKVVYRVGRGPDRKLATRDDVVKKVLFTDRFGSTDPEGLALRQTRRGVVLVVTDATNDRVYKIAKGPNRRFGDADDRISSFGMRDRGFTDTEDAFYDARTGHLFVVSTHINGQDFIAEVTWNRGRLVNRLLFPSEIRASGIVIAPGTDGSRRRFYVLNSGVRHEVVPNENDAQLLEFRIVA
ncbi:MAG TPA: hypothetical protein VFQ40_05120 [Actinomycetota bacterium]|nr:hypothetical protein [Actinomycetota bacterium]